MIDFRTALASFDRASARTVATCVDVPAQDWATRPAGRRHAIAEVLEHMALSNDLFGARLRKIAEAPARDTPYAILHDDEIPHLFERVDEPPGIAEPTGAWTDVADAVRAFERSAAGVSSCVDLDDAQFRRRGARHPVFGPLDGVQWALFAAAHTERHRSEIIGLRDRLSAAAAQS